MHNSQNGVPVDTLHPSGNGYLLIRSTPSDVCLTCHGDSRGLEFPSVTYTPTAPPPQTGAGSFIFLLEDKLYDGRTGSVPGSGGGHNLNAPSRGVSADGTLLTAPGGTYPSSAMGCSSCHDPHGNTNFRLLYGIGPVTAGGATFTNAAPVAEGTSYSAAETNVLHTAYKSGMSAWCANCHGNFHAEAGGRLEHKSGQSLGGTVAGIYGRYNGTAHYNSGTPATSYLAAVPFEEPTMTTTGTDGPLASSQVSCISCHRAHASSAPDIGRWDFNVTWLSDDGVTSGSYPIPNPYGPDVEIQRSLCNKCHAKDAGDLGSAP
jgi:cytochrome c553